MQDEDFKLHDGGMTVREIQEDPGFDFAQRQFAEFAQDLDAVRQAHQVGKLRTSMLRWKKIALWTQFAFGCALTAILILSTLLYFQVNP